jgi:hypothetical protein
MDGKDLAEQTLCAKGEETTINITRSFTTNTADSQGKVSGPGTVKVTFHRAYADTSRLILVYTIHQALTTNWGGFANLSTNQGTLNTFESSWQTGSFTQSFDTSSLPANTTQLHIQALGTTYGTPVPLAFTLPFHTTSKTVMVKQTRTGKGYTITLDRLVLTNSLTIFAYTLTYGQTPWPPDVQIAALSINGQKQTVVPGSPSGSGASSHPGVVNETRVLAQIFLGQPGSWAVTFSLSSTNPGPSTPLGEETFTFSISA